ncbi:MAG: ECF transporter S component [Oscillospiraceae bacterium]|nr:ECF transporter S component [Oscillospiraceae bacterium]
MSTKSQQQKLRALVLTSIFAALIVVMTVVPYTGYIAYGVIEITTLHIVTIIGAVALGWRYGAVIGGVWGITCIARAYLAFPIYLDFGFGNFFVACLPRILVGAVAGAMFFLLKKVKLNSFVAGGISAAAGTLTNTVLVLTGMNLWLRFHGEEYSEFFGLFRSIIKTLVGVNGLIEIIAAILIVPVVYKAIEKYTAKGI